MRRRRRRRARGLLVLLVSLVVHLTGGCAAGALARLARRRVVFGVLVPVDVGVGRRVGELAPAGGEGGPEAEVAAGFGDLVVQGPDGEVGVAAQALERLHEEFEIA